MQSYSVRYMRDNTVILATESEVQNIFKNEIYDSFLKIPGLKHVVVKSEEYGKVFIRRNE